MSRAQRPSRPTRTQPKKSRILEWIKNTIWGENKTVIRDDEEK
jgi:hypothetical protein